jgi:hypothetical protein
MRMVKCDETGDIFSGDCILDLNLGGLPTIGLQYYEPFYLAPIPLSVTHIRK